MRHSIDKIKELYNPIISIYGSSSSTTSSSLYKNTVLLGEKLTELKAVIASGGYTGIMDAISKGVSNKDGIAIGITTDEITKVQPSDFLKQEFREESLMTRLDLLQGIADYHVFLEGSTGTLTELSLLWDKMKLGLLPLRPIFLFDTTWHQVFELLFHNGHEKSIWKLDKEVENLTIKVSSMNDLFEKLSAYLN